MWTNRFLFSGAKLVKPVAEDVQLCLFTQKIDLREISIPKSKPSIAVCCYGHYVLSVNGRTVHTGRLDKSSNAFFYDVLPLELPKAAICEINLSVFNSREVPCAAFTVFCGNTVFAASGSGTACHKMRHFTADGDKMFYDPLRGSGFFPSEENRLKTKNTAFHSFPQENPLEIVVHKKFNFYITEHGSFKEKDGEKYHYRHHHRTPSEQDDLCFAASDADGLYFIARNKIRAFGLFEMDIVSDTAADIVAVIGGKETLFIKMQKSGQQHIELPFRHFYADDIRIYVYSGKVRLLYAGMRSVVNIKNRPALVDIDNELMKNYYVECRTAYKSLLLDNFFCRTQISSSPDSIFSLLPFLSICYMMYGDYDLGSIFIDAIAGNISPDGVFINPDSGKPQAFCGLLWIIALNELFLFSGERNAAYAHLSKISAVVSHFLSMLTQDRLLDYPNNDGFFDFIGKSPQAGYNLHINALFLYALYIAARLFSEFHLKEEANRYSMLHGQIKQAVNALLWDRSAHLYCGFCRDGVKTGFSPSGQAISLIYGLADRRRTPSATAFLTQHFSLPKAVSLFELYYCSFALLKQNSGAGRLFGASITHHSEYLLTNFSKPRDDSYLYSLFLFYLCAGIYPTLRGFSSFSFTDYGCGFDYRAKIKSPRGLICVDVNKKITIDNTSEKEKKP